VCGAGGVEVMPLHTNRGTGVPGTRIVLARRLRPESCRAAVSRVLSNLPDGQAGNTAEAILAWLGEPAPHTIGAVYKTLRRMAATGRLTWDAGTFALSPCAEVRCPQSRTDLLA
jgi:hypothetical protein